ncbi:hypothetical protein CMP1-10 [Clavibacter phage CMP1]|uniref:Uncharacterized protein n=1 Tax=Clavibacter phage CMP1 TaxID=686439 RepID=D0U1Z4_9CAUD|nr:hypothetical protein CMP1-10 [Clavibacter phage CMP1]ACY35906.1 hypothetical protein CMP1-10 [Clavibacter phage CMP1]
MSDVALIEPESTSDLHRNRIRESEATMDKVPGGENGLNALDTRLLEMAANRKSPQEMQDATGIPAARCAQRVREILSARDWLSPLERRVLIMDDYAKLRTYMMEMMDAQRDGIPMVDKKGFGIVLPADPRWAANMLKLLNQLDYMIDRDAGELDNTLNKVKRNQARLMVEAIELAFERLTFEIEKKYPGVEQSVLMEFMEHALPKAIALVDSRTV